MMAKTLEPPHAQWLDLRGISAATIERFGLHTAVALFPPEPGSDSDKWIRAKAVAVPYLRDGQPFTHKYRRVDPKQHVMDKGAPLGLWNEAALDRAAGGTWVITEGEWDGLTAEDLGWAASSVPNGANDKVSEDVANAKRYEYLWDVKDKIAKVKKIIIATDNDVAGICLRTDLIALFGPTKCFFVEYPDGCKDLNETRQKHGIEKANECLLNAMPVPVKGLFKLSEIPESPELTMEPILGIAAFDELFGLVPATWTPITGYPSMGKSSLVIKLIANLIAMNRHVTIASFETLTKPILERKILAALCERAEHDPSNWSRYDMRRRMEDNLAIIANTPDDEHELGLNELLDLCEASHQRNATSLVVIDPWNEIEHKRQNGESETDYTGRAIRAMKRFCHRTRVPMWMIAHPKKPSSDGMPKFAPSLYDISGSANWYNKADYGIVVHRPDLTDNVIEVSNVKVRMGLPGRVGKCSLRLEAGMSKYFWVPNAEGDE